MAKVQKKSKKSLAIMLTFCIIITILLCVSLFFSKKLEILLYLKPNLSMIDENALEVHFVDVGQGDAILIRFPSEETMLIDSGKPEASEKLQTYIDKIFFTKGENRFDYVLLTHADSDHCGSMPDIIDKYEIGTFFRPSTIATLVEDTIKGLTTQKSKVYANTITKIKEKQGEGKTKIIESSDGIKIEKGDLIIEFLSPLKQTYNDLNDVSPIIVINYMDKRIMLTGDAEAEAESDLVDYAIENNIDIDVDVLKLGHHGSKTSTTLKFLEKVNPEYAVISVAKVNSYNHPSKEIIDRIYEYNINLFNNTYQTANKGNIICYVQESELDFTFIENSDAYIYIDYYICVIIGTFAVWVIVFMPSVMFIIKKRNRKTKRKS